jgi:Domain of unknown function (DUF6894)
MDSGVKNPQASILNMPRYFFHFVWPDDAVRDTKGVELEGLEAAYRHAIGLVHQGPCPFL